MYQLLLETIFIEKIIPRKQSTTKFLNLIHPDFRGRFLDIRFETASLILAGDVLSSVLFNSEMFFRGGTANSPNTAVRP